jgi:RNA recognition motif-containing protein
MRLLLNVNTLLSLTAAAVDRVMAQGVHTIDSRNVDVKRAVPKDKMAPSGGGAGHPSVPESKKIFVGGLAPEVSEKEFKEYFEQFGPIQVIINASNVDTLHQNKWF